MNTQQPDKRQARAPAQTFTARDSHDGDGVKLKRVFSFQAANGAEALDPFLLLDEFSSDDPADYIGGFPDHPHRGFETVTYMLEGMMEHRDHMGNHGKLVPGSVQWMTAASGIIHSEMPLQEHGRMRGFQLWINLPGAQKMKAPAYQEYAPGQIPAYALKSGARIKAIAGSLVIEGTHIEGPVRDIGTAPIYLDITLEPGARLDVPLPRGQTVLSYVFEGALLESGGLGNAQMWRWGQGDLVPLVAGENGVRLLLLAATPIGEPVVQHGPFVMNTRAEIEQAMSDYRSGRLTRTPARAPH